MNIKSRKFIYPALLILILMTQIVAYIIKNEFNIFLIALVCSLAPSAIKELKPNYKSINVVHNMFLILSISLLILGFYIEFT